jgi:hypothetical protein
VRAGGALTASATVLKVKLQAHALRADVGGPKVPLRGPDESPKTPRSFPTARSSRAPLLSRDKAHRTFRNQFAHFVPASWSIEIDMLPDLVRQSI